jgi:hypothetical protein
LFFLDDADHAPRCRVAAFLTFESLIASGADAKVDEESWNNTSVRRPSSPKHRILTLFTFAVRRSRRYAD